MVPTSSPLRPPPRRLGPEDQRRHVKRQHQQRHQQPTAFDPHRQRRPERHRSPTVPACPPVRATAIHAKIPVQAARFSSTPQRRRGTATNGSPVVIQCASALTLSAASSGRGAGGQQIQCEPSSKSKGQQPVQRQQARQQRPQPQHPRRDPAAQQLRLRARRCNGDQHCHNDQERTPAPAQSRPRPETPASGPGAAKRYHSNRLVAGPAARGPLVARYGANIDHLAASSSPKVDMRRDQRHAPAGGQMRPARRSREQSRLRAASSDTVGSSSTPHRAAPSPSTAPTPACRFCPADSVPASRSRDGSSLIGMSRAPASISPSCPNTSAPEARGSRVTLSIALRPSAWPA